MISNVKSQQSGPPVRGHAGPRGAKLYEKALPTRPHDPEVKVVGWYSPLEPSQRRRSPLRLSSIMFPRPTLCPSSSVPLVPPRRRDKKKTRKRKHVRDERLCGSEIYGRQRRRHLRRSWGTRTLEIPLAALFCLFSCTLEVRSSGETSKRRKWLT